LCVIKLSEFTHYPKTNLIASAVSSLSEKIVYYVFKDSCVSYAVCLLKLSTCGRPLTLSLVNKPSENIPHG